MGFLQGLAKLRLLRLFDYLSSVSGGGYAAAWLAAWVKRDGSLQNVEKQLDPSRTSQAESSRLTQNAGGEDVEVAHEPLDKEPEPVYHVRAFSDYLTPWRGFYTVDSWTLLAIYLRNTLINLVIILPLVLAVVFVSRLVPWAYARGAGADDWAGDRVAVTALTFLFPAVALGAMLWYRARLRATTDARRRTAGRDESSECGQRKLVLLTIAPMLAAAALGVWCLGASPIGSGDGLRHAGYAALNTDVIPKLGERLEGVIPPEYVVPTVYGIGFGLLTLATAVFGVLVNYYHIGRPRFVHTLLSNLVLGVAVGLLSFVVLAHVIWPLKDRAEVLAALGPPAAILIFAFAAYLEQAVFSRSMDEYEREWRSRLSAHLLMAAAAWVAFFGVTLFLPLAVAWVASASGQVVTPALVGGWVATVFGSVFATRRAQASPTGSRPNLGTRLLALAGPVVFLVGILALLSVLASGILAGVGEADARVAGVGLPYGTGPGHQWTLVVATLACVAVTLFLSFATDVNTFSLHSLYGNRLVRCFLAASRQKGHESGQPADGTRPRSARRA